VSWQLYFGKDARKDAVKLKASGLHEKTDKLLDILEKDPFTTPPPYEKLVGDLDGFYSRRINIKHRLVYRVDKANHRVFIDRMWAHYE
jgi:Txe/YoeB family toxin of toxin-antitoxin system